MSLFIISCGGTGGHLTPGIALAEALQTRGHAARLLISRKKVDSRLIEKYPHLQLTTVPGSGFSLQPVRFARCFTSQLAGLRLCRRLVRELRPAGVVGFGGFTSAGIVLAARLSRVPVALHEANRVPGLATRVLSRFAARVYLPPGIRMTNLRAGTVRHMGLPVRKEIVRLPQSQAREALGFSAGQRLLVVFGGSQGAAVLNEWVRRELKELAADGIQVCCVTGLGKGTDETLELLTRNGAPVRARFLTFCDQVAELLSAADLVLSRAGAGSIAEFVRCATPAVLVPFPHAADDHQRANAVFFERQGGGLVIEQASMGGLRAEVVDLIFNDGLLRTFAANLQRMDRANSLEFMLNDLEAIAAGRPGPEEPVGAEESSQR